MHQIAIYGKGGIGKSTIAANLSAALALGGKKVLQVGCDPKHDSTRLLMRGKRITTVLDYLKITPPDKWQRDDILCKGFMDIGCVEAGGPEPGVGCAGRGILTTFDLLDRLGIRDWGFDLVVYDVLGDVVCGGFAVPLRHEYADTVYIITSGEYMSIYAANNILKGIENFDGELRRVGGLIFNKRGIEDEEGRITRFGNAVNIPICAVIPRSDEFAYSEMKGITLIEGFSDSPIAQEFFSLADIVANNEICYSANPLTDARLEEVVLGKSAVYNFGTNEVSENEADYSANVAKGTQKDNSRQFFSLNLLRGEPLHGCAFNGAVNTTIQIQDAITLAHGPRSCANASYQTITSVGRKSLFERGVSMPLQILPPLVSSDMNEGVMVFGGIKELQDKIWEVTSQEPRPVFVVTTCPAGIIGDNLDLIKEVNGVGGQIIPIKTDGNLAGDYLQGMIMAYIEIARTLINKDISPEANTVNIIAEKPIAKGTEGNFRFIQKLFNSLGISINCRFICKTSLHDIKSFLKAELNILAYEDYMGRMMKDFLQAEYGVQFMHSPFPVGFSNTEEWLYELAGYFRKQSFVEEIVGKYRDIYQQGIERLKPVLKGKRLMVITYNHDIDWILEPVLDAGMEIAKVCILNYSQDNLFTTRFKGQFPIEQNYAQNKRERDVQKEKPDILLSNYNSSVIDSKICSDTIPLCPDIGFFSGLEMAKRWAEIYRINLTEEWRKDEVLFKRYFA